MSTIPQKIISDVVITGSLTTTENVSLLGKVINRGHSIIGPPSASGETSRIILWDNYGAAAYTYGLGVENRHLWFGVDVYHPEWGFKWYAANNEIMHLDGLGNLSGLASISSSNGFNGPLNGTASYALTASYVVNGGGNIDTGSFATTGSNQPVSTFTLNGNTNVTITNSVVTANSIIFFTKQPTVNTPAGVPYLVSKTAGSFVAKSSNNSDSDTVAYFIINPA
jgi:hypothetical protein